MDDASSSPNTSVASGFDVLLVRGAGLGIVPAVAQVVDLADPTKTSLGLLLPILTAASGVSVQPAGTSVSALMGDREGIGPPKLNSQCEYTVSCGLPCTLVRHRFFHSSSEDRGNGQSRRSEPGASLDGLDQDQGAPHRNRKPARCRAPQPPVKASSSDFMCRPGQVVRRRCPSARGVAFRSAGDGRMGCPGGGRIHTTTPKAVRSPPHPVWPGGITRKTARNGEVFLLQPTES